MARKGKAKAIFWAAGVVILALVVSLFVVPRARPAKPLVLLDDICRGHPVFNREVSCFAPHSIFGLSIDRNLQVDLAVPYEEMEGKVRARMSGEPYVEEHEAEFLRGGMLFYDASGPVIYVLPIPEDKGVVKKGGTRIIIIYGASKVSKFAYQRLNYCME